MIRDSEDLVFSTSNFHVPECGLPPAIHDNGSDANYCGYFRNRYGEQWIVTINPKEKRGVLRGGDVGWEREIRIDEGHPNGDLILGEDERRWLEGCWMAACGDSPTSS